MGDVTHYEHLKVIPSLPRSGHAAHGGEDLIAALTGARIVQIGAPSNDDGLEGGGLVIDYIPVGSPQTKRVVLSFNEMAMWVAWEGYPQVVPKPIQDVQRK
jgi:hypothetical protein